MDEFQNYASCIEACNMQGTQKSDGLRFAYPSYTCYDWAASSVCQANAMRGDVAKNQISIGFVTRNDTTTEKFYHEFMGVLADRYPLMAPEFFDWDPKCKAPFKGVEDTKVMWAAEATLSGPHGTSRSAWPNFIKRKSKIKNEITVNHTGVTAKNNQPILGTISFWVAPDKKMDWLSFFWDMTEVTRPILARMHIFLGPEAGGLVSGSPQTQFWAGPSVHDVRGGVTNLAWANFFGDEFAHEVNEARLREHGFAVELVGNGKLFRVTDSIFDLVDDFPKFSARRAELKSLFRRGMFQITDEPALPA